MSEAERPRIRKRKPTTLRSLEYDLVEGAYGSNLWEGIKTVGKVWLRPDLWFRLIDLETRHAHQWKGTIEGIVRQLEDLEIPNLGFRESSAGGAGVLTDRPDEKLKPFFDEKLKPILTESDNDLPLTLLKLYAVDALSATNLETMGFENPRVLSIQLQTLARLISRDETAAEKINSVNRFVVRGEQGHDLKRGLIAGLAVFSYASIGTAALISELPPLLAIGGYSAAEATIALLGKVTVRGKKQVRPIPVPVTPVPQPEAAPPPPPPARPLQVPTKVEAREGTNHIDQLIGILDGLAPHELFQPVQENPRRIRTLFAETGIAWVPVKVGEIGYIVVLQRAEVDDNLFFLIAMADKNELLAGVTITPDGSVRNTNNQEGDPSTPMPTAPFQTFFEQTLTSSGHTLNPTISRQLVAWYRTLDCSGLSVDTPDEGLEIEFLEAGPTEVSEETLTKMEAFALMETKPTIQGLTCKEATETPGLRDLQQAIPGWQREAQGIEQTLSRLGLPITFDEREITSAEEPGHNLILFLLSLKYLCHANRGKAKLEIEADEFPNACQAVAHRLGEFLTKKGHAGELHPDSFLAVHFNLEEVVSMTRRDAVERHILPPLPNLAEKIEDQSSRVEPLTHLITFLLNHYGEAELPSTSTIAIQKPAELASTAATNKVPANKYVCIDERKGLWVLSEEATTAIIVANPGLVARELITIIHQRNPSLPDPETVVFQEGG